MKKSLLIIFTISFVLGQNTDFETEYYYNTIYLQQGFFGPQYVKGGESFNLISIGKVLKQYPESSELYEKAFIMGMISLGIQIVLPAAVSASVNADINTLISVYFGSLFLAFFALNESYNKLHEAIWVYNRESLKDTGGTNIDNQQDNNWQWKKIQP